MLGNGGVALTAPWGGEDREFKLRLGEWRKIEAKCNAGPEEIATRLAPTATALAQELAMVTASMMQLTGRWRVDDVREVIFQGLIGGGMDQGVATTLMRDYFDASPIRANVSLAYAIVSTSLEGLPTTAEPPGEPQGEGDGSSPSPTVESIGETSTEEVAAPASRRKKSTK